MIEAILPPDVVSVAAPGDLPDDALEHGEGLFPEEEALIARAVPPRRREFTTGRICARRALARLGLPPAPLLRNRRGAPQWPAGVVGSMTHCQGYRAVAVARTGHRVTIGIDAEPHAPLPDGVLEAIALPGEQRAMAALARHSPGTAWDRLLFSAKESVFKAWYPLTGEELGFDEADITLDPDHGTFTARLLRPGPHVAGRPLTGFSGRWLSRADHVATAVVL
ncbi:4'-phosphopantetheinyl transferase superfamily protein [Streptomyces sp. NPDC005828]|uniref:4'-phosphopantetheinyl transferase family protein n=1 Tax=Streptomyces sp. NPDC005828 TaxID=3157071 RepID=UPI00340EDA7E